MAVLFTSLAIAFAAGTAQDTQAGQTQQVTCTGQIVDAEGEPVGGVKVTLFRLVADPRTYTFDVKLAQELTTEEDGAFTFKTETSSDNFSNQAIILAEKDGLALGWANWRLQEDLDAEIKLDRAQVLAGKVIDETGKPVPGAEVSIVFMLVLSKGQAQYLMSTASLNPLMTKTDAEGRFSFGRIPPEASAEFLVKKSGKATISTFDPQNFRGQSLQFKSGRTDIELALPTEARIEGRIVEKASGNPAAGIRVIVLRGHNQPNFGVDSVTSDDDGRFSVDALDSGRHIVKLVPPAGETADWIAESVEVQTEAGKTRSGVRIEVSKGGFLEVVITDAVSKKPVKEARVSVRNRARNENFGAVSDEKGIAAIRLTPGEYQMTGIHKEGYSRQSQQDIITIEDGETTRLEWQLTGQPKLAGIVRDGNGKPLQGVKLKVCPMGGREVSSDAEGKFELNWDPSGWSNRELPVMFLLGRYEKGNLAAAVEIDEDTRTRDITLLPAVTFAGKVVDPAGKGLAQARIMVTLRVSNWGSPIGFEPVKIDAQGNFQVRAIPSEHKYNIEASAEDFGRSKTDVHTDEAVDNRLELNVLTLPAANISISGIVVDGQDRPVAGANVSGYGDTQPHCRAQTDSDGKFTFDKVCAGKIRLSANKYGAARLYGNVETEGGASDVKIVISESSSSGRYVPKQPPSLVGKSLPDLKEVKIDLPPADLADKMILVCFLDIEQRPSRNCLRQLSAKAEELAAKGVVVAAVQASKIDQKSLDEWGKKYNVSFPLGMVQGDAEKARFTWGVKSLPWLILTDSRHVVTAAGFRLSELDAKIKAVE
jgi:protocatechuate 3,4-dioxygenase beta subunit